MIAALIAAAAAYCVTYWRRGLMLCILAGFLQDPVRKILPGRPVAMVVTVAVLFLACLFGALLRGRKLLPRQLAKLYPSLRQPFVLLIVIVVAQSLATLVRWGNPTLAGLGILAYLSPVAAVLLMSQYARTWADVQRWTFVYLASATLAAVSVLAQFGGLSSSLFVSIGLDTVYGFGGRVAMYCGIMRSSEIAAFHAGTGASLSLLLLTSARTKPRQAFYGALVVLFLLAIVLTGRRKMLAQFGLFAVTFIVMAARSRHAAPRVLAAASTVLLALLLLAVPALVQDPDERLTPYLVRSTSVVQDAADRLHSMTLGSFRQVVGIAGFFGAGAGTTAQGSQYFGGASTVRGTRSEGGFGKVLAELGVPGLACGAWLGIRLVFELLRVARFAGRQRSPQALFILGLIALVPSHAAVFATAHQVYGDPFVLIVLGSLVGFALGSPMLLKPAEDAAPEAARLSSPATTRQPRLAAAARP